MTADVYLPKNAKPPFLAVLGAAGHSSQGKAYANYQTVWVSLAKRGILVLAYDPPGQEERIEYLDHIGKQLLPAGGTAETRWRTSMPADRDQYRPSLGGNWPWRSGISPKQSPFSTRCSESSNGISIRQLLCPMLRMHSVLPAQAC